MCFLQSRNEEHIWADSPAGHGTQGQRPSGGGQQAGHTQVQGGQQAGHTQVQGGQQAGHTQVQGGQQAGHTQVQGGQKCWEIGSTEGFFIHLTFSTSGRHRKSLHNGNLEYDIIILNYGRLKPWVYIVAQYKTVRDYPQKYYISILKITFTNRFRFCGTTEFATGMWAGVELDTQEGKNDGTVRGIRYFR